MHMPKRGQRLRVEMRSGKAMYCRMRLVDPAEFAKGSLRTISVGKGTKMVVGCMKGQFHRGRCSVGVRAQNIMKRKLSSGKCPKFHPPKGQTRVDII